LTKGHSLPVESMSNCSLATQQTILLCIFTKWTAGIYFSSVGLQRQKSDLMSWSSTLAMQCRLTRVMNWKIGDFLLCSMLHSRPTFQRNGQWWYSSDTSLGMPTGRAKAFEQAFCHLCCSYRRASPQGGKGGTWNQRTMREAVQEGAVFDIMFQAKRVVYIDIENGMGLS